MSDNDTQTTLSVTGGTVEERLAIIHGEYRLRRWKAFAGGAGVVAFFAMLAITCPVVCT